MITLISKKHIYKLTKKIIYVFNFDEILIYKLYLPIKEHVNSFWDIYYERNLLKVCFNTNDTYDYKATLNEETFEFSDWGLTK